VNLPNLDVNVAPFKIETRRYDGLLIENIICFDNACHINNCIEDEKHVLLHCPPYENWCHYLHYHACLHNNNVMHLPDVDQFIFTNEIMCYYSAQICDDIFDIFVDFLIFIHFHYMKMHRLSSSHIIVYIL
jgi:hypothetical protein